MPETVLVDLDDIILFVTEECDELVSKTDLITLLEQLRELKGEVDDVYGDNSSQSFTT